MFSSELLNFPPQFKIQCTSSFRSVSFARLQMSRTFYSTSWYFSKIFKCTGMHTYQLGLSVAITE